MTKKREVLKSEIMAAVDSKFPSWIILFRGKDEALPIVSKDIKNFLSSKLDEVDRNARTEYAQAMIELIERMKNDTERKEMEGTKYAQGWEDARKLILTLLEYHA